MDRAEPGLTRRDHRHDLPWMRIVGLLYLVGLSLLGPGVAWAQDSPWEWGHTHGVHGLGWLMVALGVWFVLFVLVAWGLAYLAPVILAVVAAVLGVRWLVRTGARHDRALEILRERYARGEISQEEFEARRRDLAN